MVVIAAAQSAFLFVVVVSLLYLSKVCTGGGRVVMRKLVPYIITAVVAIAVSLSVSYFVSHSKIVVSIATGDRQQLSKQYTGSKLHDGNPKAHLYSKSPQLWGPDGVEHALVKLAIAKEKGLLSEREYKKIVSILIGSMQSVDEVEVDIDIRTRIIEHDSDSEGHDSDNDSGDE